MDPHLGGRSYLDTKHSGGAVEVSCSRRDIEWSSGDGKVRRGVPSPASSSLPGALGGSPAAGAVSRRGPKEAMPPEEIGEGHR
ncbi:hypothetical protein GCM10017673_21850 [Streptosporangium violaceochromogenes]|nr:hypothetical protein GCM10017673_21850 [Streptosporangium violaceochromogenes]